mmetsp:Transcript_36738/g.41806  ORF Transcript_36738/g.41806 Transcript_36738/m.41806 type:complete len:273 (-) Transcript_36738:478-1296(-)
MLDSFFLEGESGQIVRESTTATEPSGLNTSSINNLVSSYTDDILGRTGILGIESITSFGVQSRSSISGILEPGETGQTQFHQLSFSGVNSGLSHLTGKTRPTDRNNLGSSLGAHNSFNNINPGGKTAEDETPCLGALSHSGDSLDIQIGFNSSSTNFFGTDNLLDGVLSDVISLLEFSQTTGDESGIVEFNNSLTHLGMVGSQSLIGDTLLGDIEIIHDFGDTQLSIALQPRLSGAGQSKSLIMRGNIGNIMNSSQILVQFLRDSQESQIFS